MPEFQSDDLSLHYIDEGEGDPVLLIHGFASTSHVNWVGPGWVEALTAQGFRAIAIDNRGHGKSDKPHESEVYTTPHMARDALNLLDHLDINQARVMGYSMGARISAYLTINAPDRVQSVVFGGLGMAMVDGIGGSQIIADALLAPSLRDVTTPQGRAFRAFADQTGSDRKALAACILASRAKISAEDVGSIQCPALVAVGTEDDVAGSPHDLAALMPNAEVCEITGRNHMVAVGDKIYKQAVGDFWSRH